MFVMFYTLN